MTAAHPDLQAFADGELGRPEADAVRDHLGACAGCERELHAILQLDSLVAQAPRVAPRRWARALPIIALAAAAAVAVMVAPRGGPAASAPLVLSGPRSLEARVSWLPADQWRPTLTLRGTASRGTTPPDALPLSTLAALEQQGDRAALAGAWLVSGDVTRAKQLAGVLASSATPDGLADLAAVAVTEGHPDEALEATQTALDAAPSHARALWNKALAARDLGLTALAAKTWGQVAALGEPGWSTEAAERQHALEARSTRERETFQRALNAGAAMVLEGTPMPIELVHAAPTTARMDLAYALRLVGDRQGAEALRPVAAAVDALVGGDAARAAVTRAARANFAVRAATRPQFRAFFVDFLRGLSSWTLGPEVPTHEVGLGPERTPAFVARLLREQRGDDLLLVLPLAGALAQHFDVYAAAAQASGDPWFEFALAVERGRRALADEHPEQAERLWLEVTSSGARVPPYRALQAHERLALLYNDEHRAAEAQHHAREAIALARAQGELGAQLRLLATLSDAARFRNLRGLALAALEERALRQPGACEPRRSLEEAAANLDITVLEPARARADLQRAGSCGEPLSAVGAFTFADVLRLQPQAGDLEFLTALLGTLRAQPGLSEADRLLALHVEGRARLVADPASGEALLRQAMDQGRTLGAGHSLSAKLSAYGFGLLRSAAAERGDYAAVLRLTAEELGHPLNDGCALVVEVQDDRIAVVGRDQQGAVTGQFVRAPLDRRRPLGLTTAELASAVERTARAAGAGCTLQVYAGYPLHGRAGWLPNELSWSYATGLAPRPALPGRWVVVSEVETPPELQLKHLTSWSPAQKVDDALTGAQATPERVLAALREAAFVEFDAHGLVNTGSDDSAAIVLAPGAHGYALTAAEVARRAFPRHPVVLLGACRASTVAPYMHEAWSLPRAFAQAGARAIIAAPIDLPDEEAKRFFGRFTARLARGEAAAPALRDERLAWLSEGRGDWVQAVLVFE